MRDSVLVEEPDNSVQPFPAPPLPTEASTLARPDQIAPNLLLYPVSGIWFDDDEGAAPVKEPAEEDHHEPCRVGGTVRFDLAFLKQRELFSKEQILGGKRATRSTP